MNLTSASARNSGRSFNSGSEAVSTILPGLNHAIKSIKEELLLIVRRRKKQERCQTYLRIALADNDSNTMKQTYKNEDKIFIQITCEIR